MKRNMRIIVSMLLIVCMSLSLFAAGQSEAAKAPERKVINLWSFTDEVPKMLEKYKELNPDFDYEINTTIIATT
ncbi:MAG: carbohydrate ABC transporter substrate-binding protein, partial [Sphaerochaeta sp.]|nr:carbohydrate ABC transporter substrate-binding protein [Sphaerochaeta sp.]